jgi:hypothetical protein
MQNVITGNGAGRYLQVKFATIVPNFFWHGESRPFTAGYELPLTGLDVRKGI